MYLGYSKHVGYPDLMYNAPERAFVPHRAQTTVAREGCKRESSGLHSVWMDIPARLMSER